MYYMDTYTDSTPYASVDGRGGVSGLSVPEV